MRPNAAGLDSVFLQKQRRELMQLRATLLQFAEADENDEGEIRREGRAGPYEYEDDAQKLASLELDGNRVVRSLDRLSLVNRALEKFEDGTYGISDVSGKPIPRERLEAIPEAICTIDEEQRAESNARSHTG